MVRVVSLSTVKLIPHGLTPVITTDGIRSLIGQGSLVDPLSHSVSLPPPRNCARLALKLFRGEPAIGKFD